MKKVLLKVGASALALTLITACGAVDDDQPADDNPTMDQEQREEDQNGDQNNQNENQNGPMDENREEDIPRNDG